MKKVLFALLVLMGAYAHATGPTATPTYTPTSTLTFTPSFTPTPTRTNTPVNGFVNSSNFGHIRIQPQAMLQADGITAPGTTALAGATTIWLAQVATGAGTSTTAAVFSTGSAQARLQLVVPQDYMRGASLWLYAMHSNVTNTATFQADVARTSIGVLTSTASTLVGTATNVQTEFTGRMRSAQMNRVWIPLEATVGNPGVLKPGDVVNILLTRGGTSGNTNVFAAEFEYAINQPLRP